ncbi:GNAT family N-acetyltransferase [Pleomorphovibrio marinus]|uniref:GNAT family N-acetyltransferase n=1 Tax=Pleomorphovibrio marinus TaxID=2164132 RepID=UPI000E09FBD1|nr:GNAT family N-acetyltransferase [Pleomorphovibrio marinus]
MGNHPKILLFKLFKENLACTNSFPENSILKFEIWRPSIKNFIPKGYGKKYLSFWVFHYLKVFKNRNYHAILAYKENKLIGSLLLVPKYYKWDFMENNDLQITYVKVNKDERGQGYGEILMKFTLQYLENIKFGDLWYITDTNNMTSQNLAYKCGFFLYSECTRFEKLFFKILKVKK